MKNTSYTVSQYNCNSNIAILEYTILHKTYPLNPSLKPIHRPLHYPHPNTQP